jgi:hypothetical protein
MGKYVAKLTGESDEHTETRYFDDLASAKAWLQGDGLAEFEDQEALGEIIDPKGELIWREQHLQCVEQRERERALQNAKWRARFGTPFKLPKPMKRR